MSSLPGRPPNPRLLIIDTSVIIPVLVANLIVVLRDLKSRYGIQPSVVEAVDAEVTGLVRMRFAGMEQRYRKALRTGVLALLHEDFLKGLFNDQAKPLFQQMNTEGARLHGLIDRGEAFSHAAANTLTVPIVTNDMSAVRMLTSSSEKIAVRPVLSFWDLVVFGYQTGICSSNDCDKIRSELMKAGEALPKEFQNCAFLDGLREYCCGLADADVPSAGAPQHADRLWIRSIAATTTRAGSR